MTSETKRASLAASPLSDEPRQKRETPRLQPLATNRHRASQLVETAMTSEDDFAPIWEESILLAEHEAVQASVDVGGWLSAALDDPNVCEQMKADINRWFSSGFLYLDSVRQLMQADREAVRAEQAAELAKFKALAETLAGALGPFAEEWNEREFLAECHWSVYWEASKALRQYKEARDA